MLKEIIIGQYCYYIFESPKHSYHCWPQKSSIVQSTLFSLLTISTIVGETQAAQADQSQFLWSPCGISVAVVALTSSSQLSEADTVATAGTFVKEFAVKNAKYS